MKTKSLKIILPAIFLSIFVLLAGLFFAGCGDKEEKNEIPERSTYTFETNMPSDLTVGETYEFGVTLKASEVGKTGYDSVRIFLSIDKPEELQLVIVSDEGLEIPITETENTWGPASGFELTPDYNVTSSVKLKVKTAGTFSATMKLVDLSNDNEVIISDTNTYVVTEAVSE